MANNLEYRLREEIIALSINKKWHVAKNEWVIDYIVFQDEPETCLCTHTPIKELCYLKNRFNEKTALVGNICVKKFLGLGSDPIFRCIKKITKDDTKGLNPETIEYAKGKGWINEWEYGFSFDTCQKRALSPSQLDKRIRINHKIVRRLNRSKRLV